MSPDAVVEKIIVDIQSRAIHLISDEGEHRTLDCSDNYEAFMVMLERCRDQGEDYMVYVEPTT
ncbi:MAG: hypothetical protein VXW11_08320 [Pseudomonadota bacterium]|jgi:hypothetical protein|nr:hypothetical protein [Pseudomonadota bacterium]|tara:strand:+ start:4619 stop:4807 length:189 start_codon:yes stop_codon:yes gene_type:complete